MSIAAAKRDIKQERAARTRTEILDAAIKLFARRGFLATTMVELAKAIKMTPGALYWHFPTKEDVLLAVIEELSERYVNEFTPMLEETRTCGAKEQLAALCERTQSFLRYHREYGIFFGMTAAESADSNERVADALRQALTVYVNVVEAIVRHGQDTGEFRADVDARAVAHSLVGSHIGLVVHQNLFRDSVDYDPLVTALVRLTNDGIALKPLS